MAGLTQQIHDLSSPSWDSGLDNPVDESHRTGASAPISSRQNGHETLHLQLVRAIEGEIVPRLMLVHRPQTVAGSSDGARLIGPDGVVRFADLVLHGDVQAMKVHVEGLRGVGLSIESVYVDLFIPAARHLGVLWDEDLATFAEVTIALCRLQQLTRLLGSESADECEPNKRVLLAALHGEQHTFGLVVVAEFFRRAGWDVTEALDVSTEALSTSVAEDWFDVIGLCASSERRLAGVAAAIAVVRGRSINPSIGVLVGGPAFLEHPEWAARVGADASVVDARFAAQQARELIANLPREDRSAQT